MKLHSTCVVDPRAELAEDVEVGPYSVIGPGVRIGKGTRLLAHVVIEGPSVLGDGNVIHPFSVLGGAPQHKQKAAGGSRLVIGSGNVLREHVTVHRGTEGHTTSIGDANLLMVGAHVGHDVTLGSHCVLANGVQLAGHVTVEDYATLGGLSGVAQFARIGESAFVAAGAMVERDVLPFVIVQGDRARVRALNSVGLKRRGVPEGSVAALRAAFRTLFLSETPREEAVATIARGDPYVDKLLTEVCRRR